MVDLNTTLVPRLQTQLIGHQAQWDFLIRKFEENELHPAWLLAGTKGIGKATFAYRVARSILKSKQNNDQFFDTLINQKSHPNLLIIEREIDEEGKLQNEISIESIRKIASFVQQSAAFPGWRVVIIDAIDELNRNAANALLKILEEPPKQVLILLVCHSLGRILPTIRSRCCLLNFKGLEVETVAALFENQPQPLALELANNSIGRLFDLHNIHLAPFLNEILHVIGSVLQNKLQPLQQLVVSFNKGDAKASVMLDLLSWLSRQLVFQSNEIATCQINPGIQTLAHLRPSAHWLMVQEKLALLIHHAEGTHLDVATLHMAAFLCFESPHLVQD